MLICHPCVIVISSHFSKAVDRLLYDTQLFYRLPIKLNVPDIVYNEDHLKWSVEYIESEKGESEKSSLKRASRLILAESIIPLKIRLWCGWCAWI
jgi:hypothetical protein